MPSWEVEKSPSTASDFSIGEEMRAPSVSYHTRTKDSWALLAKVLRVKGGHRVDEEWTKGRSESRETRSVGTRVWAWRLMWPTGTRTPVAGRQWFTAAEAHTGEREGKHTRRKWETFMYSKLRGFAPPKKKRGKIVNMHTM